jgi:hypothetical protein
MATIKDRIEKMDDFQVVRFFEYFGQEVIEGSTASLDQIKSGVPEATRTLPGFQRLETLSEEEAERLLDLSQSATVARGMLLVLADDECFAPVIEAALASYSDSEMVAEVVLAVGFAVSLVLMAATSELKGSVFGITLKKRAATPEMIKAITEPFTSMVGGLVKK